MDIYYESSNELAHYGVLGMKWGVRRYQNKDGSYTKAGLERYRKAESEYESAKKRRSAAESSGDLRKIRESDRNLQKAEKQKKEAYKRLQTAYRADKGKEIVAQGKTKTWGIETAGQQATAIITGKTIAGVLANHFNRKQAVLFVKGKGAIPMSVIAGNAVLGSAFVAAAVIGVTNAENNKNIDAYRSESRRRS